MSRGTLRSKRTGVQPKVRSQILVDAKFRNSAGSMGGGKSAKNKRARCAVKQDLKRGEW